MLGEARAMRFIRRQAQNAKDFVQVPVAFSGPILHEDNLEGRTQLKSSAKKAAEVRFKCNRLLEASCTQVWLERSEQTVGKELACERIGHPSRTLCVNTPLGIGRTVHLDQALQAKVSLRFPQ